MKCIEELIEEDKREKRRKNVFYLAGSIAFTVGALLAMPKVIDVLSDKFYEKDRSSSEKEEVWGPEIVLKKKEDDENE